MNKEVISLKEIVGGGYSDFWHFKGRYRVCKGSRASKKSKTTALNLIVRMIEYPLANILVVRKVYSTLKDSCYTELCWAIHRLKMDNFFECKTSPLEIMYIPTGQKIYFRGLDDPLKITSITVKTGSLCWLWIEEAYEITNEDDFNMLDESIRGSVDKSIFKQITITLNPWNERHWIKARVFDVKDNNIMAKSTNYMCNEWLDESDLKVFEDMKKNIKNWNDDKEIEQYLSDLLNKKAFDKSGLIYGMGHAVYSLSDPRANVFKSFVESLSKEKGREDEFNLYSRVERLAPQVIASERKMYKGVSANVDFYSGFVYSMLDLPMELYTPMFAIARIAGWSAHRIEELLNPGKIIRPAYKSIAPHKEYVPLDSRD